LSVLPFHILVVYLLYCSSRAIEKS